jgi:hypothetical protein
MNEEKKLNEHNAAEDKLREKAAQENGGNQQLQGQVAASTPDMPLTEKRTEDQVPPEADPAIIMGGDKPADYSAEANR